jgi:thiamine-monophosphate kinase
MCGARTPLRLWAAMSGDNPDAGDEFDLIARLFAPLARDPAARGLKDDAALWTVSGPTVMTCDAIVEGVHFFADDPIETIAQKALRVNLSDLAAKAARPDGALLSLIWPKGRPSDEIVRFAAGLQADLEAFGFGLIGGDMTATPGPLTISVMAFGGLAGARCPARADAAVGQDVWVSGTIGDAALGLRVRLGQGAGFSAEDRAFLILRYQVPIPRLPLALLLSRVAGGSMDVSDGLIADARKMAAAADVRIVIDPAAVPLSGAAHRAMAAGMASVDALLTGGDDYEILFTADPGHRPAIAEESLRLGLPLTRIGHVEAGQGIGALMPDGRDLGLEPGGFVHRMGGA